MNLTLVGPAKTFRFEQLQAALYFVRVRDFPKPLWRLIVPSRLKKKLDKTYKDAPVEMWALEDTNLVIFSDHHKGGRDGADDFVQCESIYEEALAYYYAQKPAYHLIVLGDAEELWERRPGPVMEAYSAIFKLENKFHARGQYWRFMGNHDDLWYFRGAVDQHLGRFHQGLKVRDSLRLRLTDDGKPLGEVFFVHGHQGTFWSDNMAWISRRVVRYVWRPIQRLLDIKSTTPSQDWRLRGKHDRSMYNWAVSQDGLVLIAGHTHQMVFTAGSDERQPVEAFIGLDETGKPIEGLLGDLRFLEAAEQPCYFNTGCCSYADGTISGIEITAGTIRLVRWSGDDRNPLREILASADLREIFGKVQQRGELMEEH